jgi:hypothetical protein
VPREDLVADDEALRSSASIWLIMRLDFLLDRDDLVAAAASGLEVEDRIS